MQVKIIENKKQLEKTDPFYVEHLLWGTKKCPKTYAYLGFIEEDGFYLKMVCGEENPLRTYKNDRDPVYKDSAVEAFFLFKDGIYINLEMNANGALLAEHGSERNGRSYLKKEMYQEIDCHAEIKKDYWTVELKIPLRMLNEIYGALSLQKGSRFCCNFYKISETSDIEHYAAYNPIATEKPDFHRPEYFAEFEIV